MVVFVLLVVCCMYSNRNSISPEELERLQKEHAKAVAEEVLDSIEWKDDATEEEMRRLVFEIINRED